MSTEVNLNGVRDIYRLCFVRSPWAYFTRLPLDRQWGDNWDASPWQLHAGTPYYDRAAQILKVAFDGELYTPDEGRNARSCSVLEINSGFAPWLRTESYVEARPLDIMAGVTLRHFVELIDEAGGTVYAPLGWSELPALSDEVVHIS